MQVSEQAQLRRLTRWDIKEWLKRQLGPELDADVISVQAFSGTPKAAPRAEMVVRRESSVEHVVRLLDGTRHVFPEYKLSVSTGPAVPDSGGTAQVQVTAGCTAAKAANFAEQVAQIENQYLQSGELDINLPDDLTEEERAAAAQDMSVAFKHLPAARRPDTLRIEGLPKRCPSHSTCSPDPQLNLTHSPGGSLMWATGRWQGARRLCTLTLAPCPNSKNCLHRKHLKNVTS